MKQIYVVGSFKDLEVSKQAVAQIEASGMKALISQPNAPKGIDGCLRRIDKKAGPVAEIVSDFLKVNRK